MKKLLITALCAMSITAAPVYAADNSAADLPHIDTDYGIYDLVGYDFYNYNGKDHIIIFSEYENTTDESCYPTVKYMVKLFQDGVQLDNDFSDYTGADTQWSDSKGASTEVQPGGKILYRQEFALDSTSDIDFEVKKYMGDETLGTYTIAYGSESETAPDYKAMYEELQEKYNQLESEYNALKSEK